MDALLTPCLRGNAPGWIGCFPGGGGADRRTDGDFLVDAPGRVAGEKVQATRAVVLRRRRCKGAWVPRHMLQLGRRVEKHRRMELDCIRCKGLRVYPKQLGSYQLDMGTALYP